MRILVISDMHTEFWRGNSFPEFLPEKPKADDYDVLVAAGDIGLGTKGIEWLVTLFPGKPIIYVPGNHEYYNHEYHQLNEDLERMASLVDIHLLNPGVVDIDGIQFIGANMWTDFKLQGHAELEEYSLRGFADFRVIGFNDGLMTKSAMKQIHQLERQFVANELEDRARFGLNGNERTVVITHFVPTQFCIDPKWKGVNLRDFNPYFTNDLDDWFDQYKYPVHIFGHTHDRYDVVHPFGTRMVANPLGYPRENATPYEWKIIDV
jgi:Icc-related predicted phosphoesterase